MLEICRCWHCMLRRAPPRSSPPARNTGVLKAGPPTATWQHGNSVNRSIQNTCDNGKPIYLVLFVAEHDHGANAEEHLLVLLKGLPVHLDLRLAALVLYASSRYVSVCSPCASG